MALQVRRGTNSERLAVTPVIGELIYVTDTKQLFVGDGTTVGGTTAVAGTIDSLLADTSPQLGGDLDLNSRNITGTGNINISGTITASGNINLGDGAGSDVLAIGGSIQGNMVPSFSHNYDLGASDVYWKEAWISQLNVDNQITAASIMADIIAADSTVIFNAASGLLSAAQLTGTLPAGVIPAAIASNITGNLTGNANGSHTGTFDGDMTGSVFADDSFLLVDGVNGKIVGRIDSPSIITTDITVNSADNTAGIIVAGVANGAIGPQIDFNSSRGTKESPTVLVGGTDGDGIMDLQGSGWDGNSFALAGVIRVGVDLDSTVADGVVPGRINFITANSSGSLVNLLTFNSAGNLGVGLPRPLQKLHVNGNAKVEGFVQFGSLTTTERNALTAANGMVIYNSTDNKFQGRENGAWVNLV
jgi:hypothetical protein